MQARKLTGAAFRSREAKLAGKKLPLRGAALRAHEAKLAGLKLPLGGAALRAHELKKLVGGASDEPMMIGDKPVLSLDEMRHDGDSRVPWDGQIVADENFVLADEPSGQPTVEDDVLVIDAMLDDEPLEESKRWDVLLGRLERWEARKARKEAAIERERHKLQQMIFVSSTDVAAAAAVLEQRLVRHEAAKRDYKRFVREQELRRGVLRGDPRNIPAARERIAAMTPQQRALPYRRVAN